MLNFCRIANPQAQDTTPLNYTLFPNCRKPSVRPCLEGGFRNSACGIEAFAQLRISIEAESLGKRQKILYPVSLKARLFSQEAGNSTPAPNQPQRTGHRKLAANQVWRFPVLGNPQSPRNLRGAGAPGLTAGVHVS